MKTVTVTAVLFALMICSSATAQTPKRISLNAAIDTAIRNNLQFAIRDAEVNKAGFDIKTANDIPKTGLFAENEDLRPSDGRGILKIGLSQSIAWPGLYKARREYFNQQLKYAKMGIPALQAVIRRDVKTAYYELWYLQERMALYQRLDSIYTSLFQAADLRFKTGEGAGLERIAADTRQKENQAMLQQNGQEILVQQRQLMMLLNKEETVLADNRPLEKIDLRLALGDSLHPLLALQQQSVEVASSNIAVQKNTNKPELSGRFFTQRLWGAKDPFSGFSVSAAFPLFGASANRNKVKAAEAYVAIEQTQLAFQSQQLNTQRNQSLADIEKSLSMLRFYESSGLKQSDEIIHSATLSYKAGEISFAELSQFLGQAIDTKRNYLTALNQYNQSVIQFNYYNNNK